MENNANAEHIVREYLEQRTEIELRILLSLVSSRDDGEGNNIKKIIEEILCSRNGRSHE